jgi:hypothetical protein
MAKIAQFKNKKTGVIWEIEEGTEAFKRCKRSPNDYEEIKQVEKPKTEKSG